MPAQSVISKVVLSRRLFEMARVHSRSGSSVGLSLAVILLQDAVEFFLLALAEHVNAQITVNTSFAQYLDLIDEAVAPQRLPFRSRLITLNRVRVNCKHYAIVPAKSEIDGLLITAKEFFQESATAFLETSFSSMTLIELIEDDTLRRYLSAASTAFEGEDYVGCLVNCRKAFYLQFEKWCDVSPFENPSDKPDIDFRHYLCSAPYYARNEEYIKKYVIDPTDYIVIDHQQLGLQLVAEGIDTVAFWNVWRLTPKVYFREDTNSWITKTDVGTFENDGLSDRAEYVLDATVTILLQHQLNRQQQQEKPLSRWTVDLVQEEVPLRKRPDPGSDVVATTPAGVRQVHVSHRVDGLPNGRAYWYVLDLRDGGLLIKGFLDDELVVQ